MQKESSYTTSFQTGLVQKQSRFDKNKQTNKQNPNKQTKQKHRTLRNACRTDFDTSSGIARNLPIIIPTVI